jgi:hypothetical protein
MKVVMWQHCVNKLCAELRQGGGGGCEGKEYAIKGKVNVEQGNKLEQESKKSTKE